MVSAQILDNLHFLTPRNYILSKKVGFSMEQMLSKLAWMDTCAPSFAHFSFFGQIIFKNNIVKKRAFLRDFLF